MYTSVSCGQRLTLFLASALCLTFASDVSAEQISSTADGWVGKRGSFFGWSYEADGTGTGLHVEDSYHMVYVVEKRACLQFGLGAIPDTAIITSASLNLYVSSMTAQVQPAALHRATYDGWTEGTLAWPGPGGPHITDFTPSSTGWLAIDLLPGWDAIQQTEDLADDVLSFRIASTDSLERPDSGIPANLVAFASRETSYDPYLEIEYIPEPATSALILLGSVILGIVGVLRSRG